MPKLLPHGESGGGPGPAGGMRPGPGEPPERWFWDPGQWGGDERGIGSHHGRLEPHAAWAAVLGLAGLVALGIGQTRHFGGLVDAVVAVVALGGTLSALVSGSVGLSRIRSAAGELRGRGLASTGVAEAWLAVLVVTTAGVLAMATAR